MERLTCKKIMDGHEEVWLRDGVTLREVIQKLSDYEDNWLEPEDIAAVKKALGEIPFDRFREILEAEQEGRLVAPPCKVGDTIWTNFAISGWYFRGKDRPYKARVVFIGLNDSNAMGRGLINVAYGKHNYMTQFPLSDVGKCVFLTREEAEEALKKREEADNEAD